MGYAAVVAEAGYSTKGGMTNPCWNLDGGEDMEIQINTANERERLEKEEGCMYKEGKRVVSHWVTDKKTRSLKTEGGIIKRVHPDGITVDILFDDGYLLPVPKDYIVVPQVKKKEQITVTTPKKRLGKEFLRNQTKANVKPAKRCRKCGDKCEPYVQCKGCGNKDEPPREPVDQPMRETVEQPTQSPVSNESHDWCMGMQRCRERMKEQSQRVRAIAKERVKSREELYGCTCAPTYEFPARFANQPSQSDQLTNEPWFDGWAKQVKGRYGKDKPAEKKPDGSR